MLMATKIFLGKPNTKQDIVMKDTHRICGYGGARGGGKSWMIRTKSKILAVKYKGIRVLIVRQTFPELDKNHIQFFIKECCPVLGKYNKSDKRLTFHNGSIVDFQYCNNDSALTKIQGSEYDVIFIDEATNLTEHQIKSIMACCRGTNGFPKRIYLTANPGGQGHAYFKRVFIDKIYEEGENPEDYSFTQALVFDNEALMQMDPDYIKFLEALPPKLRKGWLYGDWNIFSGQVFEEFCNDPEHYEDRRWTHIIEPFDIPIGWKVYRSYDFGYSKPFSVGWWAIDYEGRAYRILELYGCTKTPNEGVKWSPHEQFKKIAEIESQHPYLKGRKIEGVADPAIWQADFGESVQEVAMKYGVYFHKGDNSRIAGWMQMHYRMAFDEDGYPMMYIFNTCNDFIRTIPLLIYDEHKVEDIDTELEDHCLSGATMVLTEDGYKPIESLVGTDGRVLSHDGEYHNYYDVRCTRKNAEVYRLELEDGTTVICTDDHRFMTLDGDWVRLKNLEAGMEVMTIEDRSNQRNNSEV